MIFFSIPLLSIYLNEKSGVCYNGICFELVLRGSIKIRGFIKMRGFIKWKKNI